MRFYHIPDRDRRKAAKVFFAGSRIFSQRSGTAITGSDDIGTYDKMFFRIYVSVLPYHARPPANDI